MQESYVWLLCGCTLAFGRLHDLCRPNFARREQVRVKARTRDTASGGSRARPALASGTLWEGCSSLGARSGCTLGALRHDFHRPRHETILNRTIAQSYDQRNPEQEAAAWACQLLAAADRVPFAGAALPRLVLCSLTCQWCRHVKARGRLSSRTLGRWVGAVNCTCGSIGSHGLPIDRLAIRASASTLRLSNLCRTRKRWEPARVRIPPEIVVSNTPGHRCTYCQGLELVLAADPWHKEHCPNRAAESARFLHRRY